MKKDYGEIICQARDGVALLTLNRPQKLNSITPEAFSGSTRLLGTRMETRIQKS